jgi:hypothetical protein
MSIHASVRLTLAGGCGAGTWVAGLDSAVGLAKGVGTLLVAVAKGAVVVVGFADVLTGWGAHAVKIAIRKIRKRE